MTTNKEPDLAFLPRDQARRSYPNRRCPVTTGRKVPPFICLFDRVEPPSPEFGRGYRIGSAAAHPPARQAARSLRGYLAA